MRTLQTMVNCFVDGRRQAEESPRSAGDRFGVHG